VVRNIHQGLFSEPTKGPLAGLQQANAQYHFPQENPENS